MASQHRPKVRKTLADLDFEALDAGDDLANRAVRNLGLDYFAIAAEREVVVLARDLVLRNREALLASRTVSLGSVALPPTARHVRKVVPVVVRNKEGIGGDHTKLVVGQQRRSPVVEGPTVGLDVVEPDVVGTAGVGLSG